MNNYKAGISNALTLGRAARVVAVLIGLAFGVYFIVRHIPRYFIITKDSYGPYFWPRAWWLLPHIVFGLLAITIGPLQLWSRIRENHKKFHRLAGRVYLVGVAGGSVAAIGLVLTAGHTLAYRSGLFFLALAWIGTTGMAFAAIRRRHIAQHRQWMIRSYVVTFAFVTVRFVADIVHAIDPKHSGFGSGLAAWACWAVPLLITEMVIQGRAVFSKPEAGDRVYGAS